MLSRMAVKVVNIGKGLVAASTQATKVSGKLQTFSPQQNAGLLLFVMKRKGVFLLVRKMGVVSMREEFSD